MPFDLSRSRTHRPGRRTSAPPRLETLEDRTVPTISLPTPGTPGLAILTGTVGPDLFVVRLRAGDASTIEFSDNGGAQIRSAALADITGIVVDGQAGNDRLQIDNANGYVGKAGGLPITYDGGIGVDALLLTGNPASVSETYTGSASFAGTISGSNGTVTQTIAFAHLTGIIDLVTAASLTVNLNDKNNLVELRQGFAEGGNATIKIDHADRGDLDDAVNQAMDLGLNNTALDANLLTNFADNPRDDNGETFVPFTFANKTAVTINALGGNDTVALDISAPAAGLASLTLDGGTGSNNLAQQRLPATVALVATNFARTDTDPNNVFIQNLYAHRLHRFANDTELTSWRGVLASQGAGVVANAIERSAESRTQTLLGWYRHYLGREGSTAEVQGWVSLLGQNQTEEQVLAQILGSAEFANRANNLFPFGSTPERFVRAMYALALNRLPGASELNFWVNQVNAAGNTSVAFGILSSQEFHAQSYLAFYTYLLHREADAPGYNSLLSANLDLTRARVAIEGSPEFFNG
jgi:hypothetical protein